jgi:Family of unknown function (DUF5906)
MINSETNKYKVTLSELGLLDLWCGWKTEERGGSKTKIPHNSRTCSGGAKANDPKTWGNLSEAQDWVAKNDGDGPGVFFSSIGDEHNLCGVDLDSCRDVATGELLPWAAEVVSLVPSYAEVSPSQTGVKVFFLLSDVDHAFMLSTIGGKSSAMFAADLGVHAPAIELHFANRYFAVTGVPFRPEDASYEIKTVSRDAILRVLTILGPALAKDCPQRASTGVAGDSNDSRRSGRAFKRMLAMAKAGMSEEDIRTALSSDPDVGIREWLFEKVGSSEAEWVRTWGKVQDIVEDILEDKKELAADIEGMDTVAGSSDPEPAGPQSDQSQTGGSEQPKSNFDIVREYIESGPPEEADARFCACAHFPLDEVSVARLVTIVKNLMKIPKKAVESNWKKAKKAFLNSQKNAEEGNSAPIGNRMMYGGIPKNLVTIPELNARFGMYQGAGSVAFIQNSDSWIIPKNSLLDILADQIVLAYVTPEGFDVYKPAGKVFLGNCDKTVYNQIVFQNGEVSPNALNLFHGFGVTPQEGKCGLILTHILEVICSGDKLSYERFLDLLAWQIQHIGEVSRIIVVLFTKKHQAGKGIILDMVGDIYGPAGAHITEKENILGKFNTALQGKAFVFFDESIFGGSVVDANKLKTLATAKKTTVEGKFVNPVTCPIAINIFMATNSEHGAHVEEDDARYWILNCSEHRIGQTPYFKSIENELKTGGKEAFMHFLLSRDVSDFEPQRDTPRDNVEKHNMIRECRNALDIRNWLEECCRTETIIGWKIIDGDGRETKADEEWGLSMRLTFAQINQYYKNWQKDIKSPGRLDPTGSKNIAKLLQEAGIEKGKQFKDTETGRKVCLYLFPTVETCLSKLGVGSDEVSTTLKNLNECQMAPSNDGIDLGVSEPSNSGGKEQNKNTGNPFAGIAFD